MFLKDNLEVLKNMNIGDVAQLEGIPTLFRLEDDGLFVVNQKGDYPTKIREKSLARLDASFCGSRLYVI